MQAAKQWRIRPLEFLGVEEAGALTDDDRMLIMGLELYERSLCPDCRQPARVAFDPDMDGWFEVDDTTVCYACAARERYVKRVKNPEPGLKIRVVDSRKED